MGVKKRHPLTTALAIWRTGVRQRLEVVKRQADQSSSMNALATRLRVNYMRVVRWFSANTLPTAQDLTAIYRSGWSVDWLLTGEGNSAPGVTRPPVELAADLYADVVARLKREGWTPDDVAEVFETPDDLMLWFEQETVKAFEQYVGRRKFFNKQGKQTAESVTITEHPEHPGLAYPVPPRKKSTRPKGGR